LVSPPLDEAGEIDLGGASRFCERLRRLRARAEEHLILEVERFYEIEVNGVRLVDWVEALLAGETARRRPLRRVHGGLTA
jgi:hypothetical protein